MWEFFHQHLGKFSEWIWRTFSRPRPILPRGSDCFGLYLPPEDDASVEWCGTCVDGDPYSPSSRGDVAPCLFRNQSLPWRNSTDIFDIWTSLVYPYLYTAADTHKICWDDSRSTLITTGWPDFGTGSKTYPEIDFYCVKVYQFTFGTWKQRLALQIVQLICNLRHLRLPTNR